MQIRRDIASTGALIAAQSTAADVTLRRQSQRVSGLAGQQRPRFATHPRFMACTVERRQRMVDGSAGHLEIAFGFPARRHDQALRRAERWRPALAASRNRPAAARAGMSSQRASSGNAGDSG